MEGIYYIKNTVDKRNSFKGYFATREEVLEVLKEYKGWFRPKGTGKIYFQPFGLHKSEILIHEVN